MCGVCGVVVRGGVVDPLATGRCVSKMVEALAHRGPDDRGLESGSSVIFGATRLAIRGLISGHQPLVDDASGVVVVCNGEIDNHAELRIWLEARGHEIAGDSDIAVLPALYAELGEDFVDRITGVFAIALWDPARNRLLLARDRIGERPLFYAVSDDAVVFATELAALGTSRQSGLSADLVALRDYLEHGAFVAPLTPFAEVSKVGPAEIVAIDDHGVTRRRYWRWNIVESPKLDPDEDEFDSRFRAAIRRQTEVDVDFGVFLSGGLDSSLVAAVLRSVRPDKPLRAYTLRFAEPSFDEGDWAAEVADRLGIELVTVWCGPDELPSQLARLIETVGEPLADPAWVPTASLARRAATDVKMCLSGEGGDEIFGGYPTYVGARLGTTYRHVPAGLRKLIAHCVEALPHDERKVSVRSLLRRFVQEVDSDDVPRHRAWTSCVPPRLRARLLAASRPGPRDEREIPDEIAVERGSMTRDHALDVLQRLDLETKLAEGLLTKTDRATMQSGLELRTPYLDRDVAEFAATLAVHERVHGLQTKVFLKRYALRYLPVSVVQRRKRGLSVPLAQWLRGPLESWARNALSGGDLARVGIDRRTSLGLLEEHLSGRVDHSRALWTLLALREWIAWSERVGAKWDPVPT